MTEDQAVSALREAGCVFAEAEARMIIEAAGGRPPDIDRMVARRCAGEPLELVVGYAEIAGIRMAVHPGVFVPRRRSEQLISETAAALGRITSHVPVVVDLGCGSGALLVAVLSRVRCTAYAIDNSPAAVECARENLTGSGAYVIEGSRLSGLPARARGDVDVIMANLPYVPTDAIPLLPREARLYEPQSTLDGGPDGLTPLEVALAEAATWLRRDGHYLGELHQSQVDAATLAADRLGFDCATTVNAEDGTAVIDLTPRAAPGPSPVGTR